jgi:hypothetical protein
MKSEKNARPILSYSTRMRAKKRSSYPELFNPDESKKNARPIPSYSTRMRAKKRSTYPELFNPDESKQMLVLSQVIQPG